VPSSERWPTEFKGREMALTNHMVRRHLKNKFRHERVITFSTSSAYAESPGFSALKVSWVKMGVSTGKMFLKQFNYEYT
jgi:hypothetical protein